MKDKLQLLLEWMCDKSDELNTLRKSATNMDESIALTTKLNLIDEIIEEAHFIQNRSIEERLTLLETKFYEQFGE